MRLGALILTAALLLGCTANAQKQLPRDAAVAMTGSPGTLNDISRLLVIEGIGENFNVGQNLTPDAELPKLTVTHFQRVMQFGAGRWRQDQTRVPNYVTANMAPQRQITAVDGDIAFNVNPDGTAVRQPDQVAKDRRAELYHHPTGFLQAIFSQRGIPSNTRTEGNFEAVDMTVDGATYTMYVDPATKLPAKITSIVYNANLGDVLMETSFGPYVNVQGHRMPSRITTKLDKWVVSDIQIQQQTLAGAFGNLAAPDDVKSAQAANLANVTVEEVSRGVWYLAGASHHSVLVEFADHLVLVEAPQNETRALAVIQKARELVPTKPLRYLVNTHHHFDHSGGIRAAVAEGLTIITQEGNKALFEDVVARKHTLLPDVLAKNPKPLMLETVKDKRVLQDGTHTLELYHVPGNPHTETMLMAYLPAERLLIEADLYTPPAQNAPRPPGFPFAPNLLDNVQRNGLGVTRLLPIHGFIVPFAHLQSAVQFEEARARLATSD